MDGARLANALASTGESLADVTWRAGRRRVVVRLRQEWRAERRGLDPLQTRAGRRNRGAAQARRSLLSKGRFLAAQILAMLEDDLWLENARAANAAAQTLADGGAGAAGLSGRSQRDIPPGQRDEAERLRDQGSISTTGDRARSGWSPAGTNRARRSTGSPRRSPRSEACRISAAYRHRSVFDWR